jgi:4-hydroxybenzoate polyprenyltransferase
MGAAGRKRRGLTTEATMQGKIAKIVMGVVALMMALAFFAPPVIKLKDPAMIIIILIGVAAMIYNFIEVVREKDDK